MHVNHITPLHSWKRKNYLSSLLHLLCARLFVITRISIITLKMKLCIVYHRNNKTYVTLIIHAHICHEGRNFHREVK